jgi:putative oxidoreductase
MDEGKHRDLGLLVLRVGIGGMFVGHGLPKLMGGPARWTQVGEAMGNLGIDVAPAFWGFAAAVSEFGGGLLLAAGIQFRAACALLLFTMIVASVKHVTGGDGFGKASHAIEAAILFLSLILIGPGRYRLRRPG